MKKLKPALKKTAIVLAALGVAYLFIWQRIALQSISADIRRMESEVRYLEKSRDFQKSEITRHFSLENIRRRASSELDMVASHPKEIIFYSDSLLKILKQNDSTELINIDELKPESDSLRSSMEGTESHEG